MWQGNSYNSLRKVNSQKHRRIERKIIIRKIAIIPIFLLISVLLLCALKLLAESNTNETKGKVESYVPPLQIMPISPTLDTGDDYNYSKPVPETDMVDADYFNDAVFIGDSRTEGLLLNTQLTNAIEYTHKGLMVDTVLKQPIINMNGDKISVIDALKQTKFSKVYIMLGINETGWIYNNIFIEKYGKVIDEIKEINPDAVIYVQEILPVSKKVSDTHSYVKNGKIAEYNELIRKMAEEKRIYYIDIGSNIADSNGCLPEGAATDGIHLSKTYCERWLDYLKTHTVAE